MALIPSFRFPISGRSLLLRARRISSVMVLCSGIAALILLERYSPRDGRPWMSSWRVLSFPKSSPSARQAKILDKAETGDPDETQAEGTGKPLRRPDHPVCSQATECERFCQKNGWRVRCGSRDGRE